MAQVPVFDIYIGKRRRTEIGDLEALQKDFKENGQITAITVRPPTDEEKELGIKEPYILVAGGRRLAAALMLGWETIEAYTRADPIDEIKHRVLELKENLERKEMTWDEISTAKAEILALRQEMAAKEGKTITQAEVARELKENPGTFSRDIKAAEAIAENPELKKSSSRKAALRVADMIHHEKALTNRINMAAIPGSDPTKLLRNVVRTQDARDFLRVIQSKCIDLILTDPPFGIDYWKQGHKEAAGGPDAKLGMSEYDDGLENAKDILTDIVPLYAKVIRETGWILMFLGEETYDYTKKLFSDCCATHFDYRSTSQPKCCNIAIEEDSPNACRFFVPEPKPWIWYRPNSRNRSRYPERHAQNQYEDILVVNGGSARLTKHCGNVLVYDAEYGEERIHANQKPLDLLLELIDRTTLYGDTVLDTFFGSGAHLAAAMRAGRFIMGCDLNEDMLAPALGFISKNYQPLPLDQRKRSAERYHKNKEEQAWMEIEDTAEIL